MNISLTISTLVHVLLILGLALPQKPNHPIEPPPIEVSLLPAIPSPARLAAITPEQARPIVPQVQASTPPVKHAKSPDLPKVIASNSPLPAIQQTQAQPESNPERKPEREEPKREEPVSATSTATSPSTSVGEPANVAKTEPQPVVQQKEPPANSAQETESIEAPRFGIAYLNNPSAEYPPLSERKGEHGTVLLKVLVNQEGKPESVALASSSGFERLDKAAMETVRAWRFVPAKKNNVAIRGYALVPINFSLD